MKVAIGSCVVLALMVIGVDLGDATCSSSYSSQVQKIAAAMASDLTSAMSAVKPCKPRRYVYFPQKRVYVDAKAICVSTGGTLALPRNAAENAAVRKAALTGGHTAHRGIYIGYSRLGTGSISKWVDESGKPLTYTHMHRGEPNNDGGNEQCGELLPLSSTGVWNDMPCTWPGGLPFVCQYN